MFYPDPSRLVRGARSYRVSSWDRSGKNQDFLILSPGQTVTLIDERGPGKIAHLYWTTINGGRFHYRQLVLRAWWDGEETPSVEAPLGDLFCVPHGTPAPVQSLAAVVNPGDSRVVSWGHNLYLPMPFNASARLELTYDAVPGAPPDTMAFWYHVELEQYDAPLPDGTARFHAQWRRQNPLAPKPGTQPNTPAWNGANIGGQDNYIALEALGCGQMVGLHLQVDNLGGGWYGEGDDMVFIDDERDRQWPPVYHGTGTEEIFGGGAGPNHPYTGPYTGFHRVENPDYAGKHAMYRWWLVDPIRFERSLAWTIEHGHDNNYANDYTSLAYWYQAEPHAPFPALPGILDRLPRFPDAMMQAEIARIQALKRVEEYQQANQPTFEVATQLFVRLGSGCRAMYAGQPEEALAIFTETLPCN